MYYEMIPTRWCQLHRWRGSWRLEQIQTVGNDEKQGYLGPNQIVTEPETPLMAPSRCSSDGRLWRKWCFIHDQKRLSQIETTSMTTHQSSQNGDTSVTKITISSPMTKCDATIVTKFKSSQTRHKWTLVTIMASSVTLGERHRWQHPY
jgi:hypothetical protein